MMAWNTYLIFSILLLYECQQIRTIHLTSISVPEVADIREIITLSCSYNMGTSKLNSVKWYKDGQEFFRYAPMMEKQISTWSVDGVMFSKDRPFSCNKTSCSINLDNLNIKSSGAYRCEISGDAPEFRLSHETSNMTVIALPRHDPIITGQRTYYEFGELVSANCTSDMSNPPASLSWYINDEKVPYDMLMPQQETTIEMDGITMRYRTLELKFFLDEERFGHIRGKLYLKCYASIERIPLLKPREAAAILYILTNDLNNERLTDRNNADTTILETMNIILAINFLLSRML